MKKLSIIALVITPLLSLLVSCGNGPTKSQLEVIEGVTKKLIAHHELLIECFDSACHEMRNVLDNGEVTVNGYKGEGITPKQVMSNLAIRTKKMKEAFDAFDPSGDFQISQIEDSVIRQYANNLMNRTQKVIVVFGDFTPVKTSGKTKMWVVTDLKTGYEFKVSCDDEYTGVTFTDESSAKKQEILLEHAECVTKLYDEYEKEVKQLEEEAKELARSFWGF